MTADSIKLNASARTVCDSVILPSRSKHSAIRFSPVPLRIRNSAFAGLVANSGASSSFDSMTSLCARSGLPL